MRRLLVALLLSIICGSANAQVAADAMYSRPGTLISAGDHRLNFYCMGTGSPTIVLEGGFGDWSPIFLGLQTRLAAFTRTCSYDRAGFGFSEPGPAPRSAERLADELHTALHNGHIDGPYFLVALAFGSVPARAFADRWMPEVAGLVLINGDARDLESPEMIDYWHRLLTRQPRQMRLCRDWVAAGKSLPMTPPADYPHLNCYAWMFRGLPDPAFSTELNSTLQRQLTKTPIWDTMMSELEAIPADDAYLAQHRTSFGARPVRVLTANLFHDTAATPSAVRLEHMRIDYFSALAQSKFLELSSNAKQIFTDTGIVVHFEKPDLAVDTIREAWEQSKGR